jgi:hypothetical protein
MVDYKPGATNVVADALSRHDAEVEATLLALSTPTFHLFDELRQEFTTSTDLRRLMEEVASGSQGAKW